MFTAASHCGPYTQPDDWRPHPHTLHFKMNFNSILPFQQRSPKLPLVFCFSGSIYVHVSHLFQVWGMPCPHHTDFCHPDKICQRLQIITAPHYDISWFPVMSSHVQTFLSAPCSTIPSVYVHLSWWNNQVSHPHQTMCNTTALCSTQITQYCCWCLETCKLCHTFMCYLYITLLSCILLTEKLYLPSFFSVVFSRPLSTTIKRYHTKNPA
jgi:hypothetical protein